MLLGTVPDQSVVEPSDDVNVTDAPRKRDNFDVESCRLTISIVLIVYVDNHVVPNNSPKSKVMVGGVVSSKLVEQNVSTSLSKHN